MTPALIGSRELVVLAVVAVALLVLVPLALRLLRGDGHDDLG